MTTNAAQNTGSATPNNAHEAAIGQYNTVDNTGAPDNVIPMQVTSCVDAGGAEIRPPMHAVDKVEEPGDKAADESEDDLGDDETPDALDEAAAKVRYDYERRTLPYPEPVDGEQRHRQFVQLRSRRYARLGLGAPRLCQSGHAGDLGPSLKGLGAGGAILIGGDVVAAEMEEVIDLVVGGEEALGLAG
jgi:hypothetical protein